MTNTIGGSNRDELLLGTDGDDVINAMGGNDTIYGGGGTDEIDAGDGNDYINPGDNDWYDWVLTGNGQDVVDLRDIVNGFVSLGYVDLSSRITVNLDGENNSAGVDKGINGFDEIYSIKNALESAGASVSGTRFDDVFNIHVVDGQSIRVRGGDGKDQYNLSGGGDIQLEFRNASNSVSIDLGRGVIEDDGHGNLETINGVVTRVRMTEFDDYVSSVGLTYRVRLEGLDGNDTIVSGSGRDMLIGGDGDDILDASFGGLPSDTRGDQFRPGRGADTMYGNKELYEYGDGSDISYGDVSGVGGLRIVSGTNGSGTVISGDGVSVDDSFTFVHFFEGSQDDDFISGSDHSWEGYAPLSGADTVEAGEGYDVLFYEWEADWLNGKGSGIKLDFAAGSTIDTQGYLDTFSNIEEVRGSHFDDYMSAIGYRGDVDLRGNDGNDVIIGGAGNDDLQGDWGNDVLTGGDGADRFIFRGPLNDHLGTDVIRDFNPDEGDTIEALDPDGNDHQIEDLDLVITSNANGDALVETRIGNVVFEGWTASELKAYLGIDPVMPDPTADTFIVQRGIVGKGSGYDQYVLSNWMIDAESDITITDSGDNGLQFIDGFAVSSSMVAADALMLTLSNGAVVTVLGAASYDYTVGGNPLTNEAGMSLTYQTFVEDVLGVNMPTGRQIVQGGPVTINSKISNLDNVIVTDGIAVIATAASEDFRIDLNNGGSFTIDEFDVESDRLSFSGLTGANGDTLSNIHGETGIGGQTINVQENPFTGGTFVNLGIDEDGEVVSLTLGGITQVEWPSVALVF